MLIGEHQHCVDVKGRLIIPAKFRDDIGSVFYVTKGLDNCLRAYSKEEWEKFMGKINALPDSDTHARLFKREFLANSDECELDKQGRILISSKLREFASITKDVVVIGVSSCIEIWDKEKWETYNKEEDLSLEDIAKEMAAYGL